MRLRAIAKLIMVSLLLMAAVGLAWWVGRELRSAPGRRIMLTSGVEISVLGVTYGTNHVQPGFGRLLPGGLRAVLARLLGQPGAGSYRFTTSQPELVVWLAHNSTNSAVLPSSVRVGLADENGFLSGDYADFTTFFNGSSGTPRRFAVWPRRSRELRIRVFEQGPTFSYHLAGEVRCANPAVSHASAWTAEPLPARGTNGPLVCTLSAVMTGLGMNTTTSAQADGTTRTTFSPPDEDGDNHTALRLAFTDSANPSNDWEIAAIQVADATGNSARNSSLSASFGSGPERNYQFKPALWPTEPWQIEFLAARRPGSLFAPQELVAFTNVPLPASGLTNRYAESALVGATKVRLVEFVRREPLPEDARGWSSGSLSQLKLTVANLPADAKFTLVRATDETGRKLEVPSSSWGNDEPHDAMFSFLRVPVEARSLNLTFAVQAMRRVTFTVQPALATTNDFSRPDP